MLTLGDAGLNTANIQYTAFHLHYPGYGCLRQ